MSEMICNYKFNGKLIGKTIGLPPKLRSIYENNRVKYVVESIVSNNGTANIILGKALIRIDG